MIEPCKGDEFLNDKIKIVTLDGIVFVFVTVSVTDQNKTNQKLKIMLLMFFRRGGSAFK